MRSRRRRWWILGTLGVVVIAAAVVVWLRWRGPSITTVSPRRAEVVQTLVTIGRVDAPAQITFAARESTKITRVGVDEGAHVVAGELLVQMDQAEAEAMVLQAQASLQQAQSRTKQVATIAAPSAAAGLREARANLEEARREFERSDTLFRGGNLDADDLDVARTTLAVARTRARTAELQQAAVSKSGADWQSAIAAEMFAEAGLVAAQARLDRLQILAPSPGTLIERTAEVGDVVQAGTTLGRMTLDGPTRLVIEPDEKNLRSLALHQRAVASAEAFPDQRFDAVVEYIAPAVDALRGTIEVRLAVADPPAYLRTDMTVSVEIEVGRAADTLAVPLGVVHELASDTPWVLVVEGGIAVRRELVLGLRGDAEVEVREGLDGGEALVPVDHGDIEPGDRVR
jgi:HlyD family secretion protein